MQLQELGSFEWSRLDVVVQCDGDVATATFSSLSAACAVDQNFAHGARNEELEMRRVVCRHGRRDKLEISLVHECGGAQRFIATTAHTTRDTPEFVICNSEERIGRHLVAGPCAAKQVLSSRLHRARLGSTSASNAATSGFLRSSSSSGP